MNERSQHLCRARIVSPALLVAERAVIYRTFKPDTCRVTAHTGTIHQAVYTLQPSRYFLQGPAIAPDMWASRTVACPRPEVCRWRSRSLWLISLPPQREPRCEAVRSPLSPRSQVLTFLHSLASTETNPEKMFSACFSAPPRLRVKQHLSNSTRSRPRRNSRRLALSGRLRTAVAPRIGKAWSAHRRVRNFCAILRAMRVCPPEYQHLHSRSPKHFRAILINTRKAIALPNPRV